MAPDVPVIDGHIRQCRTGMDCWWSDERDTVNHDDMEVTTFKNGKNYLNVDYYSEFILIKVKCLLQGLYPDKLFPRFPLFVAQ